MRERSAWVSGIGIVLIIVGACQRADPRHDQGASAEARDEQVEYTIGWHKLQKGMDPTEVLRLLNEPVDIKVTQVNTHWYYSADGGNGPHVVFDTRSMRVDRWRPPARPDDKSTDWISAE